MKRPLLKVPDKEALGPVLYEKRLLRTNPKILHHKSQRAFREEVIQARKQALINALKVPPAIQQFRNYLSDDDFEKVKGIFMAYKPENRRERRERLRREKEEGRVGDKPVIVKSGIRHVTDLIEEGKARLVLIACDVDPVEIVLFLPTLCRKMGVSYAFVKSRHDLGAIVGRKSATTLCLCGVTADKRGKFEALIKRCNSLFVDNYETMMSTWGTPAMQKTGEAEAK